MTTDLVDSQWYTANQLAKLLKIDPSSLRRWRTAQPPEGPPFVKVSQRRTLYNADDVETGLKSRRTDPNTTDTAGR